jgi:hypothetical protein
MRDFPCGGSVNLRTVWHRITYFGKLYALPAVRLERKLTGHRELRLQHPLYRAYVVCRIQRIELRQKELYWPAFRFYAHIEWISIFWVSNAGLGLYCMVLVHGIYWAGRSVGWNRGRSARRWPALSRRGSVGSTQGLTARMFPGKILTGHKMSASEVTGPVKKVECRVNTRLDCQDVPR